MAALSRAQKAKMTKMEKAGQRNKKLEKGWKVWPTTQARSASRSPTPRGRTDANSQRTVQQGLSPAGRSPREVGALAAGVGAGQRSTEEKAYSTEYGAYRRQDIEDAWTPPSFMREPSTPRSQTPTRSLTPNRMPPEILPPAGKPSGFMDRFVGSPRSRPCPRGEDCPYYSCPLAHPPGRLCPRGEDCTNPNCDFVHPQRSPLTPFSNSGLGTPFQLASVGHATQQEQFPQIRLAGAERPAGKESLEREDAPDRSRDRWKESSPEIPIVDAVGARVLLTSKETWAEDFVSLWESWADATSIALREGGEVPPPPAPPALPKGRDVEVPPHLLARLTQAATFAAAFLAKGAASNKELRRTAGQLEEELIHTKDDRQRLEDLVGMLGAYQESGALDDGRRVHGVPLWSPPAVGGTSAPPHDTGSPHHLPKQAPMTPEHESRLREILEARSTSNSPEGLQRGRSNSGVVPARCTCGNVHLHDEAFCRRCGKPCRVQHLPEAGTRRESDINRTPQEMQRLQAALRDSEADKQELVNELRRLQNLGPNPQMRSGAADVLQQKDIPHVGNSDRYQYPPGWGHEHEDDDDDLGPWGSPAPPKRPSPQQSQNNGNTGRPPPNPQMRARNNGRRTGLEFSDDENEPDPIRGLQDFRRGLSLESLSSDSDEDLLLSSRGNTRGNFNSKGGVMSALRRFDEEVLSLCHALGSVGAPRARRKDLKAKADRHLRDHERDRIQAGGSRGSRDTPKKAEGRTSDSYVNTLDPRDVGNPLNDANGRARQLLLREDGRGGPGEDEIGTIRMDTRDGRIEQGQTGQDRRSIEFADPRQDGRSPYAPPTRSVDQIYDGVGRDHNTSRSHNDQYHDPGENHDSAYSGRDASYYNPNPYLERNPGRRRPGREAPSAISDQSVAGWAAAERRQHLWHSKPS